MLANTLSPPQKNSVNNSLILYPEERTKLLKIEEQVSSLLTLSDLVPVRVALATYAANYLYQEPLWIMIVAPPSSGKTAILGALYSLPHVQVVSDISKGSLLSGTSKKETSKDATGGLLYEVGDFGFLVFKDFTSILSKNSDSGNEVIGALREIYDGDYSRHFGNDGGTHKEWHGRLGLIAAVTPEIEKHRSVMSSMGDRFIMVRVYNEDCIKMAQARKGLQASGSEKQLKAEMQKTAHELFSEFQRNIEMKHSTLSYIHDSIAPLAAFVADCRTPVDRSSYGREVELIHTPEGYARLAKQLYCLFCGCIRIGCSLKESWDITVRVGLDTIPQPRSNVIEAAKNFEKETGIAGFTLDELRSVTRLPKKTNERIAEDLYMVKVLDGALGTGRSPSKFWFSDSSNEQIDAFSLTPDELVCNPEISDDHIPTHSQCEKRDYKLAGSDSEGMESEYDAA